MHMHGDGYIYIDGPVVHVPSGSHHHVVVDDIYIYCTWGPRCDPAPTGQYVRPNPPPRPRSPRRRRHRSTATAPYPPPHQSPRPLAPQAVGRTGESPNPPYLPPRAAPPLLFTCPPPRRANWRPTPPFSGPRSTAGRPSPRGQGGGPAGGAWLRGDRRAGGSYREGHPARAPTVRSPAIPASLTQRNAATLASPHSLSPGPLGPGRFYTDSPTPFGG